jgi:indolepyruvate ferredoxin oxidoreductase
MERGLIGWYEALVSDLLPHLGPATVDAVVKIAALPMEIRGYGPVKEAAADKVKTEIARLRGELEIAAR